MAETIVCFLIISVLVVQLLAEPEDRRFLLLLVVFAWTLGLPLLALANAWLPFSGGGDDFNYYRLADTPIKSWADAFDLGRFKHTMVQPGYPWLLSLINYFSGHSLYVFKASNLLVLILLSIVWYKIALILSGRLFAKKVALLIICCTPLWFYIAFLLKDLIIVLLQNIFLLGLVSHRVFGGKLPWFYMVTSTLSLTLFRTPLILVNLALLATSYLLLLWGKRKTFSELFDIFIIVVFIAGMYFLLSSPHYMNTLGIYSESRMLGTSGGMVEMGKEHYTSSSINRTLFPVLYLFGEISGFNPATWSSYNATWLRGITAIPWVVLGVPLFFISQKILYFSYDKNHSKEGKGRDNNFTSNAIQTPWTILFIFIISYVCISWQVGDTTRWRLPDMPVFYVLALFGWTYSSKRQKNGILISWICLITVFASAAYLARGL